MYPRRLFIQYYYIITFVGAHEETANKICNELKETLKNQRFCALFLNPSLK